MPARSRSVPVIAALVVATLIAAACSSSSGAGRTSGDGGEGDSADEASDATGSSSGGTDATGAGSSSGGPPADLDAPQFGPDGCALLNTPCTMGSQCCSGMCAVPQLVCTKAPSQP